MAEGLLRQMLSKKRAANVRIHSAGTHGLDDQPAAPFAIQAAAEMGIDLSGHRARSLDRDMVVKADLILVMEPFHREIVARAVPREESDKLRLLADFERPRQSDTIDDPYTRSLKIYRACLKRIQHCLEGVVDHLQSGRPPG